LGFAATSANKESQDKPDAELSKLRKEVERLEDCNRKLQEEAFSPQRSSREGGRCPGTPVAKQAAMELTLLKDELTRLRTENVQGRKSIGGTPRAKQAAAELCLLQNELTRLRAENAQLRDDSARVPGQEGRLQRSSSCTEDSLATSYMTLDDDKMSMHPWKKGLRPQLQQLREMTDLLHGFLEGACEPLSAVRGACIELTRSAGKRGQQVVPRPFKPGSLDGDQAAGVAAVLEHLRFFEHSLVELSGEPAAVAFPPPTFLNCSLPSTPVGSLSFQPVRQDLSPNRVPMIKEGGLDRLRRRSSAASADSVSLGGPRLSIGSHLPTPSEDSDEDEVSRISLGRSARISG